MIEDVLDIETNGQMFEELKLFGQSFKLVMIYGQVRRTIGVPRRNKRNARGRCDENNRKYIIDDGTESITVNHSHCSAQYSGEWRD